MSLSDPLSRGFYLSNSKDFVACYRLTYKKLCAESARLVLPWHLRGRTVQLITCGTVQLFFDFLLRLISFFLFCSFCIFFLFFLLVLPVASWLFSCFLQNLVFLPNTVLNLFAIFSSFSCSKLNFLPFPVICRLCITCGTVKLFKLFFDSHHLFCT